MSQKHLRKLDSVIKQEAQDELEDKRTTSLFPEVFKCLVKWNGGDHQHFNLDADLQQAATVGEKIWTFPLNLRLVCSDWNKAIENYYQTNNYKLNKTVLEFKSGDLIDIQAYTKFLNKFGHEVKSIFIEVKNPYKTTEQFYAMLIGMLRNLSNLENLSIIYKEYNPLTYFNDDSTNQLEQTISLNPSPIIEKLKHLYINGRLDNQVINEFIRKSNNLEVLRHPFPNFEWHGLDYSKNLPYLTELHLEIKSDENFEQIKKFGKNWKIKKFFCNCSRIQDNWSDIFQMLGNNWAECLQDLYLTLPKPVPKYGRAVCSENTLKLTVDGRLELPKLKLFQVLTIFPISLDFLLPSVGSLESIAIGRFGQSYDSLLVNLPDGYCVTMDKQLVDYLGNERDIDNSKNIWSWFFTLQWIESEGGKFFRPAKYDVLS